VGAVLYAHRTRDTATLLRQVARLAVASSSALALVACGSSYRPVVSSINPVGPAGQPTKYAVAISSNGPSAQGLATLIDNAGDTVVNTTLIGVNPTYLQLAAAGFESYTINGDGTLNSFPVSTGLLASQVLTTTLPQNSRPQTIYSQGNYLYIPETNPARPAVAELFGTPPAVQQEFPISGGIPTYVVGANNSPRAYTLVPATGGGPGTAVPIETQNNTVDGPIAVGVNPTYGVMTPDSRRAFVLNKGSNSVSVINAPANALDVFPTSTVDAIHGFTITNNIVTVNAPNALTPGASVVVAGLTTGTYLNGQTLTVLPTGLSATQFQAAFAHANVTANADIGTATLLSSTIPVGVAPVWADFAPTLNELFVLSQGNGTTPGSVTVVSIPLCSQVALVSNPNCDLNNPLDAQGFGSVLGTIPVGINPVMIAVLQDGSQAFVANAGNPALPCSLPATGSAPNCSVSVINVITQTVIATIPFVASTNQADLVGHGRPNWIAATTGTPTGKAYITAGDSSDITIIRSLDAGVETHLSLQGNGVAVRMSQP
jgi:DNA-binding beta-propeller fold protein YncE